MLLSIQDLRVSFRMGKTDGVVQRQQAVGRGDVGVSFDVPENTTVALVGESGSGKSVTAMSILNLLPDNAERQGVIRFQDRDMLAASVAELQAMRGREIASSVINEAGGNFDLTELLRELEDEMQRASANLEFERAALLRDQIMEVKSGTGLTKIEPKRKAVKYTRGSGRRRSRV